MTPISKICVIFLDVTITFLELRVWIPSIVSDLLKALYQHRSKGPCCPVSQLDLKSLAALASVCVDVIRNKIKVKRSIHLDGFCQRLANTVQFTLHTHTL